MSVVKVTSSNPNFNGKVKRVLLFGASWHTGCHALREILEVLASTTNEVFFGEVDADTVEDMTSKYKVTAVPTLIFLNSDSVMERLEGGIEPSLVTVAVQKLVAAPVIQPSAAISSDSYTVARGDSNMELTQRLERLITSDTVMLFMKGTPSAPKCGFSRQAVELLNAHQVPFGSFDILNDNDVRQGLKKHSNWPTYPQIYVNGELQGGLDILNEMAEVGSLAEQWKIQTANTPAVSLTNRLNSLVRHHDVMLFMKGLPSAPRCGFSRQLVAILDEMGVSYDAFDVLQDEDIRQGLKTYSNWPTFPQLYVKGELLGGLDICKELLETGELKECLK